jgi:hypothetical protein
MYLRLTAHGLTLEKPDDCASLAVRVPSELRGHLAESLRIAGIGIPAGPNEVDLHIDSLKDWAVAGQIGPDWGGRWDAMVRYASANGWVSADGTLVRAHIEPSN